jgi:hypothetical protein
MGHSERSGSFFGESANFVEKTRMQDTGGIFRLCRITVLF